MRFQLLTQKYNINSTKKQWKLLKKDKRSYTACNTFNNLSHSLCIYPILNIKVQS